MRISEAIEKVLAGWGIARDKAEAEAVRLAALYPDGERFATEFSAWVAAQADATLNLATLSGTLLGIGRDIWSGNAGKDAQAFHGNV